MRLLTFTAYPSLHVGGVSIHARELGVALTERGHSVDVATVDRDGPVSVDDQGVTVHGVDPRTYTSEDSETAFALQNFRALGAAMRSRAPDTVDLVTAHGHFFAPAAVLAADSLGVPLVFHAHNMYSADLGQPDAERAFYEAVEREIITRSDWIIAISDFIAKMCLDLGARPDRVRVIPKGLHLARFAGQWRPPARPTLFYAGRLSPEKGVDVLLHALHLVRAQHSNACLVVAGVGDAAYAQSLRDLAATLDLRSAVAFLGNVPGEQIVRLFQASSVTVVPSRQEALGRVALEAMCAAAPVVVTDTGGLGPLVQPGVTGWRVPPDDPDRLAAAILECLADQPAAARMGLRGREYVTNGYNWGPILDATLKVYEAAVAG